MDINKINQGYVVSNFDEDNHAKCLVDVLNVFSKEDNLTIFGISKDYFSFLCSDKNNDLYGFNVKQFLEERILHIAKGKLFVEDNIAENIEMLWLNISNENDLSKIINLNLLFTAIVFKKDEEFSKYEYIIYHIETVDNYKLFIKHPDNNNDVNLFNILTKLIEENN